MRPTSLPLPLLAATLLTLLQGCAGYRLGPTDGSAAGERSVEIRPFSDNTAEPRLIEPVAAALRKQVQRDGSLRLVTGEPGDILVTGTLLHYVRNPLTLRPDDLFSTRDYEVRLTARVVATEQPGGRVRLDREFSARIPVRSTADLASAERQAAPLVAEELARQVTSALVDGTW